MNMNKIILASASPRRKYLLESSGLSVSVMVSNIEEIQQKNESALDYVMRNAKEKGLAIGAKHNNNEIIVSADTIVVTKEGQILEKPENANHAREMLNKLSNSTHLVYTAYAITKNKSIILSRIIETKVTFRKLFEEEIETYIVSGEPFDKAGGYGIQGSAMGFVESVEGSYTNVMGLPLSQFILDFKMLHKQA